MSAEKDVVNLAFALGDGMHVHVPHKEEEHTLPVISAGQSSISGDRDGLVDINSATLAQLESLPGLGPTLAQSVIEYREMNGPFKELDEIMEVPGIGPGKFESIKDLISIK